MTVTPVRLAGRRVLVSRPDGSRCGDLSVDILATLARAKVDGAAACLLRPPSLANEYLFELSTPSVPMLRPRGISSAWCRARWRMNDLADRGGTRLAHASSALWREVYLELRRHIGDERLPSRLRERLRGLAQRSFARASTLRAAPHPYPRRLLRERIDAALPDALFAKARAAAADLGIAPGAPTVALEARTRIEAFAESVDYLVAQGYTVVRVGDPSMGPLRRRGVVDVTGFPACTPLLDVYVLLTSEFVICGSADVQRVAYLTGTPSLTLNATDAFSFYPVRQDGLYTLKTVIDVDTGTALSLQELLTEAFFRNLRNYGYRDNTGVEILDAVKEMREGLQVGWRDSPGQARYRALVAEAGTALAARLAHVATWGPDRGFIGDGRLARVQADVVGV